MKIFITLLNFSYLFLNVPCVISQEATDEELASRQHPAKNHTSSRSFYIFTAGNDVYLPPLQLCFDWLGRWVPAALQQVAQ